MDNNIILDSEPVNLPSVKSIEEFVSFPCSCGENVKIFTNIKPGDVVVTNCDNCDISWTVYNPSLVIRETKDIPVEIQQKVWGELSQ